MAEDKRGKRRRKESEDDDAPPPSSPRQPPPSLVDMQQQLQSAIFAKPWPTTPPPTTRQQQQQRGFEVGGAGAAAGSRSPQAMPMAAGKQKQQGVDRSEFGGDRPVPAPSAAAVAGAALPSQGTPSTQQKNQGSGEPGSSSSAAAVEQIVHNGACNFRDHPNINIYTNADDTIRSETDRPIDLGRLIHEVNKNKPSVQEASQASEEERLIMSEDVLAVLLEEQRMLEEQHAAERRRRLELEEEAKSAGVRERMARGKSLYISFLLEYDAIRRQGSGSGAGAGAGAGAGSGSGRGLLPIAEVLEEGEQLEREHPKRFMLAMQRVIQDTRRRGISSRAGGGVSSVEVDKDS
uniref:Uncharacterized protein n=1 Tax=Leersia perrieri TaxID=77586 RepID=A0A0D9W4B1_9ORYZ